MYYADSSKEATHLRKKIAAKDYSKHDVEISYL